MGNIFRPGQKVRIVAKLEGQGCPGINSSMLRWLGKELTLTERKESCNRPCQKSCFYVKENEWIWSSKWFESNSQEFIELSGQYASLFNLKPNGKGAPKKTLDRKVLLGDLLSKATSKMGKSKSGAGSIETPILPAGTRHYIRQGDFEIVVVEQPPQVRSVLWENKNEDEERYLLGFPYTVFIIPFIGGVPEIEGIRCFYRSKYIESINDDLFHTNLENIDHENGWLCIDSEHDFSKQDGISKNTEILLGEFWSSTFNNDIDHSDFHNTKGLPATVRSIEEWQEATKKDPLFVLNIPWKKTGKTIREVLDDVITCSDGSSDGPVLINDASQLADIIYKIKEVEQHA